MDYMDPDVCCPNKAVKFNLSLNLDVTVHMMWLVTEVQYGHM